jgi:iron-sulfur cluster repair protein YtfE (RIC family)
MLASHLVEVNELSPPQLCHYIDHKQYTPVRQSLEALFETIDQLKNEELDAEKITLASMLFVRLKDETEQLIRNDRLVLFPLIEKEWTKPVPGAPHLPLQMIRDKNKKILSILDRLRQIANSYILKPEWSTQTRLFFEELFGLDQMITQAIYLKENVLVPKLLKYND